VGTSICGSLKAASWRADLPSRTERIKAHRSTSSNGRSIQWHSRSTLAICGSSESDRNKHVRRGIFWAILRSRGPLEVPGLVASVPDDDVVVRLANFFFRRLDGQDEICRQSLPNRLSMSRRSSPFSITSTLAMLQRRCYYSLPKHAGYLYQDSGHTHNVVFARNQHAKNRVLTCRSKW
jgi:hypothetical protein